ncbi:unnamed protein product [Prorocentrum cordatum]|uniref:Uncharacterized protein n=1 Tax=Prorocentrum cordatum TaxID=2364126 RepID=A0ABN9SRA9_9DINO|nr:unnamed protein product [Polarella glacialis]
MTLIDAAWLLRFANGEVMPACKGVVPAWQQLPLEAKVDVTKLQQVTLYEKLPIGVLSYGWASRAHPDPTGEQLQRLVPMLRAILEQDCGLDGAIFGIIWDFMSLPQRGYTTGYDPTHDDRTAYELERFKEGLKGINVWYGHPSVTTLVCDWPMPGGAENAAPIERRGWCIFEKALSSVSKRSSCLLTLSRMPASYWDQSRPPKHTLRYLTQAAGGREPPLPPDMFETLLRDGMAREATEKGSGIRFTNGKDATDICIPQYREGFLRLMGRAEALSYDGIGIGDAGVAQLLSALRYAHSAGVPSLATQLNLRSNQAITDAALPGLAATLEEGVMPKLEVLLIDEIGFEPTEGMAKLVTDLKRSRPSLRVDVCDEPAVW